MQTQETRRGEDRREKGALSCGLVRQIEPARQRSHLAPEEMQRGRDFVRVVCISDTHDRHENYTGLIPEGDVLLHTGDALSRLREDHYEESVAQLNTWFASLPHAHKVYISGNNEIAFRNHTVEDIQAALPAVTYLQDSGCELLGMKLWGSPWTSSCNMAFSGGEAELAAAWAQIPADTDILMTHLPPATVLDLGRGCMQRKGERCPVCGVEHYRRMHWGCFNLFNKIREVNPLVAAFGHVHDCNGAVRVSGGDTLYINSAMDWKPRPVVFDVELPADWAEEGESPQSPRRDSDEPEP